MTTDELLSTFARALRERIAIIGDRELREADPVAHLAKLKEASDQIERLQLLLPPTTDPQLKHYLQRCSYQKALSFIEAQIPSV